MGQTQYIYQRGATFNGGGYTEVNTSGSDYIARDKTVKGDEVRGDKAGSQADNAQQPTRPV